MSVDMVSLAVGERRYDFDLTVPMWEEFVEASNDYGLPNKRRAVGVALFFVSLTVAGVVVSASDGRTFDGLTGVLAVDAFVVAFALTLLFSREWNRNLLKGGCLPVMASFFSGGWPDVVRRIKEGSVVTRSCLVVGDSVVSMCRWVDGREFVTEVGWGSLSSVTVTPLTVTLSPLASGQAPVSWGWVSGVTRAEYGGVDGCVMVARSVLPDVDGFVADCRARIERAHGGVRPVAVTWRSRLACVVNRLLQGTTGNPMDRKEVRER